MLTIWKFSGAIWCCLFLVVMQFPGTAFGQHRGTSASAMAYFTVNVVSPASLGVKVEGSINQSVPVVVRALHPGPYALESAHNSNALFASAGAVVAQVPVVLKLATEGEATVEVRVAVPRLTAGEDGGEVQCILPTDGVTWTETGQRLNPNAPIQIHLEPSKSATLTLGVDAYLSGSMNATELNGVISSLISITGM